MAQPSSSFNDAQDVMSLLISLKNSLAGQDGQGTHESTRQLMEICHPPLTMKLLSSRLFQKDDCDAEISSEDALTILSYLASSDPANYLKPASRAVRDEAVRWSKSSTTTTTTDEQSPTMMVVSDNLLTIMVTQLSGNDVEVAENATVAMVACCQTLGPSMADRAIRAIMYTWRHVVDQPQQVGVAVVIDRSMATTVSIRCASAVVDLICLDDDDGDAVMESAIRNGATTSLLQMMTNSNDPLLQISTLDLMEKLITTTTTTTTLPRHTQRAKWLFSNHVIEPLLQMVGCSITHKDDDNNSNKNHDDDDDENENDADPILGGPALRLLSYLCRLAQQDVALLDWGSGVGHELLIGFHRALHKFSVTTTASGELDRLALIDAISSFASASAEALELVLNDPVLREAWLTLSNVAQPKLKSAILTSIAMVMNPPLPNTTVDDYDSTTTTTTTSTTTTTTTVPLTPLVMKLYSYLGVENHNRDTTELVLTFANSPLPELRLGAYTLLEAVAKRGTGAQVLLSSSKGGFVFLTDFLLNRDIENTKIGKEAKYAIVKAIMASEAKTLLAESIVQKLELFLQQGPYYMPTQSLDIMTE